MRRSDEQTTTYARIGATVARADQPFASSSSVSMTRFEKPHSL